MRCIIALIPLLHRDRTLTDWFTARTRSGLSVYALDYLHDAESNSIGTLLLQIAAAEVGYQAATLDGRELSADEKEQWGAALDLARAKNEITGHALDYYVSRLAQVRAKTLAELARRDDRWLEEETTFGNGQRVNNHYKWFHVLGHEINHRGQIRWLRKRAKPNAAARLQL